MTYHTAIALGVFFTVAAIFVAQAPDLYNLVDIEQERIHQLSPAD